MVQGLDSRYFQDVTLTRARAGDGLLEQFWCVRFRLGSDTIEPCLLLLSVSDGHKTLILAPTPLAGIRLSGLAHRLCRAYRISHVLASAIEENWCSRVRGPVVIVTPKARYGGRRQHGVGQDVTIRR